MLNFHAHVVVADGHSATVYRNTAREGVELEQVEQVTPHSLGHHGGASHGPDRHGEDTGEAAFAKQLVHHLNELVMRHKIEEIVVIADPHTLGRIRPLYHGELKRRVVKEISKTMTHAKPPEIVKALSAG